MATPTDPFTKLNWDTHDACRRAAKDIGCLAEFDKISTTKSFSQMVVEGFRRVYQPFFSAGDSEWVGERMRAMPPHNHYPFVLPDGLHIGSISDRR